MLDHTVRITTGSRLHFGMFSFGHGFGESRPRQFGGVGLMVAEPGIRLWLRPAPVLDSSGPLADRAVEFVRRAAAALKLPAVPQCHIRIEDAAREHIGLGTGTQLGMAIATAVHILAGQPLGLPGELAGSIGRAARSAIGSHGFAVGGLLVEAGKRRVDEISPLVARLELPAAWRVLLLLPRKGIGLYGDAERDAFARLPPVPAATTASLCAETMLNLLPAAAERDFDEFSASLSRFGQLAGSCFAPEQRGTFLDPRSAGLAARLRELGVAGVGQSSWGPTVFALVESESKGYRLAEQIHADAAAAEYDCILTKCANQGAHVEVE